MCRYAWFSQAWSHIYHTCSMAHTKIPIAAVKLILYFTGTYPASEKVVIRISLARICHIVAPISVTFVLVAQFEHRIHGNTNKSEYGINMK